MLPIRPFLQDFPCYLFHGLVKGDRFGLERGINGIRDSQTEVLERDRHLGVFEGIEIWTQLMARDLSHPLDLQHALCRYRSSSPFVDGLIADSQKVGELLNAAGFIDCFLDA